MGRALQGMYQSNAHAVDLQECTRIKVQSIYPLIIPAMNYSHTSEDKVALRVERATATQKKRMLP